MPTTNLCPFPKLQFLSNGGVPLNGGKLFTYIAGTTTKLVTYTDATGGTPNADPIILDAFGRCDCWLDVTKAYKFVLAPSTDTDPPTNPIWTVDNVTTQQLTGPWAVAGGTADAITGAYTPVNFVLTDGLILGFRALLANLTTTPTFSPDGLTARTITRGGGQALLAGDIPGALAECLVRYNLVNTRWELLNPALSGVGGTQTLTDGANVSWNVSLGFDASWTAAGNRTLNNPTNTKAGFHYVLRFIQDATGNRTVTWGSNYRGVNGASAPQQPYPTAGSETDYFFYSPDGTLMQLVAPSVPALGQCQLSKSGSNLLLSPYKGGLITINGKLEMIPDAGVTLAPPAVASTSYYIYAFMNAGVMTLENSATAPAVQSATGVSIKSGDGTRTLVGQARTTAGNAWADSATQRFVRSWFNDPGIAGLNTFSADRSTASTTYVELNTEIRIEFLVWTGEVARYAANGGPGNSVNTYTFTAVGFDGTAAEAGSESGGFVPTATANISLGLSGNKTGLAEGYHYATLLGEVNSGTGTWYASTSPAGGKVKTYLHIGVEKGSS